MGADIRGIGTDTLHIRGVSRLHGADHRVIPDRIETGTYAMAVAMTGGNLLLENTRTDLLQSALDNANFAAQATTFAYPDASQSRGEIGGRLGGQMGSVMPYVGVYAVDVFSQDNKFNMITAPSCPGACMELTDVKPGDYAKTDFGFTIASWGGLEGFLKGEALFGNHTEGFSGRLGVRWHW